MSTCRRSIVLLVLLVLAAAGAGGGSAIAAAPRSVSVTLDWVPNPDHVGLYWALEQGFFARAGLKVSMRAPSDPAAPLKLVGVNRTDLAISYEPELFLAAQKGLPAVAVAAVIPVPLNSLIATAGSGVRSARDLRGRTVGITGIPSDSATLDTIGRSAGLRPGDLRPVSVGYNLVTSLLTGKVDAIVGGFRNVEAIQIAQETGREPTVIPLDRVGVPSYDELVLVANATRLRSDKGYADMVRRFVGALVRGSEGARSDPAAAARLMARVSDYKPKFLAASIPLTLRLLAPPGGRPIGCLDEAAWQSYGEWMFRTGLLKRNVDAATVMSKAYLPGPCRRA